MTDWWSLYKQDFARYQEYRQGVPLFIILLTEQGLWAILYYRVTSTLYRSCLPWVVKRPLLILATLWQKIIETTTGISIPYTTIIGPGFYIGHFGGIILHENVVIGHTCNISQGVTIGISGRQGKRGVPKIGNRVYIATNAVVAGEIIIGDDAVIGANSLVTVDVPNCATVLGVPAKIINRKGSMEYIHPLTY